MDETAISNFDVEESIPVEDDQHLLDLILSGNKSFDFTRQTPDGELEVLKLRFRVPGEGAKRTAGRKRSIEFNVAWKEGIPPLQQVLDEASKSGIWDDKKKNRLGEVQEEIDAVLKERFVVKSQEPVDLDAVKVLDDKLKSLWIEQVEMANLIGTISQHTAEVYANQVYVDHLILKCVEVEDGETTRPLYKDQEELEAETDPGFASLLNKTAETFFTRMANLGDFF